MLEKIREDLKRFIKSKNKLGSNVVRTIISNITNEGLKDSATEESIMNIIKKEIKKRREAIKLYSANNRDDLAKVEEEELSILESYLPEQMTEQDLMKGMKKIKDSLESEGKLNMGELIKASIKEFSSSADNSMISKIAKGLTS
ncbi:MAG: GatB/YqeY domain-containing protein [Thermodesulfobacteriota bacteirum]|nr:GatB/YqeY domain-containing protein [Thermodesulfobacteriota bacterium]